MVSSTRLFLVTLLLALAGGLSADADSMPQRRARQSALILELNSGDVQQCRRALRQVSIFGKRKALPAVRRASRNPLLQAAALEALACLGDVGSANKVMHLLAAPRLPEAQYRDADIARAAHRALSVLGTRPETRIFIPLLATNHPR